MTTAKIFIGYRTRPVEGAEAMLPAVEADKRLTDPKKVADDLESKRARLLAELKDQPYTGTFDSVFIMDPKHEKVLQFDHGSGKTPVSVRVRNFFMNNYPDAWSDDTHGERRVPEAVIVGFDPRRFLKMLGLECSLPAIGKPLPLRLWYDNADHRDIEAAVKPSDFRKLDLVTAVKARRPADQAAAEKWDAKLKDWPGPHVDPETDVWLAVELATQLGILRRPAK
jgi:hypothetical protein